ncbi:MFS transporter [Nocardioides sp. ChNu-153]|uniref:MFS transporter n=1 Tax=Nocardioides sp. ChNu-153 TaxID=2779364 RepID=UPI002650FBC9|nr:MFS transporter [Nocardioides sp. ChNu-153]MDN7120408.1 MFS transporter [Nocardioides sp. ChNu-153]
MSPTFRSLRNPNYRLYAAGGIVSNTGTWMQRVAQDWLVLAIAANGATALGITTALQFLPMLLLSPYAGVVADRVPKRRLLQVTQLMMAVPSAALGVLAVTGTVEVWHVYTLAFLFGVGTAFDAPARQSFVSEIVDEDDLTNAVGLNSASFNAARLVGPALAGVMIAALGGGVVGTGWVILINAVSYLPVIAVLGRLDGAALHSASVTGRRKGALREGLRYVRGRRDLMLVLAVVFFAGTFGLNFSITSALMVTEVFGRESAAYGLVGSAVAVGSLTGALLAAGRAQVRLRLVVGAGLVFSVAVVVAGLLPTYWSFVVFAPVLGITALTMITAANTRMQIATDPALRGRVMALYLMIFMGGTPVGAPLIGWVGEEYGARWTLVLGGAVTLVGILVSLAVLGHLRPVLTALRRPGSLGPRVWHSRTVERAGNQIDTPDRGGSVPVGAGGRQA